jgi:toxin CcdB
MPQFTVYQNKNLQTRSAIPYLLDVQSDLLSDLDTRVVIPLARPGSTLEKRIGGLTPILRIDGEPYLVLTPQLAGIPKADLGRAVTSFEEHRFEIIAAIDFLVTGI